MNIVGGPSNKISLNKGLLQNYIAMLKNIQMSSRLKDEVRLDTLIHLPGVLSLTENRIAKSQIWPRLRILVQKTLDGLLKMRQQEGRALYNYLRSRAKALDTGLDIIKARFKKVIQVKIAKLTTPEESSSFLKDTDITEEIERLAFHIRNFQKKLTAPGPIGKELDFIAQEMQREANTMGAKSCDTVISGRVVQTKSQIEKIREQLQNIE